MREQRTDSVLPAPSPPGARVSPAERSLHARMAAYAMHARHDSRQTSAPGRAAFLARFERQVDPDGHLDPQERARRAELARRAYFARLSLAAAKARRAKRATKGGVAS
jgi:hypothetical protein